MNDKSELLKRAAQSGRRRIDPPAAPAKSAAPRLPLPQNRVVGGRPMTEFERTTLLNAGWDGVSPLPTDTAEMLAELQAELSEDPAVVSQRMQAEGVLGAPAELRTVDLDAVPEKKRDEYRRIIDNYRRTESAGDGPKPSDEPKGPRSPDKTTERFRKIQRKFLEEEAEAAAEEYELPIELEEAPEPPKTTSVAATPNAPENGNREHVCPRCAWDVRKPFDIDPQPHHKHKFLACMLAHKSKPYGETFDIFGGEMVLDVRQLTSLEREACLQQAHMDLEREKLRPGNDWLAQFVEYRMDLQLVSLLSKNGLGATYRFPDGLCSKTNPNARETWRGKIEEQMSPEERPQELLPLIHEIVAGTIFLNDSIRLVAMQTIERFNRLNAYFEAKATDDSFWRPIES